MAQSSGNSAIVVGEYCGGSREQAFYSDANLNHNRPVRHSEELSSSLTETRHTRYLSLLLSSVPPAPFRQLLLQAACHED